VVSFLALRATFLPWPQHFKDGLDYAAAVLVVRRLDEVPSLMGLWPSQSLRRIGLIMLLAAALTPHLYFRYRTYMVGKTAGEPFGQDTAVAPADELRAIAWLRQQNVSEGLILAPVENADWMATVPMHSFASHWIFSLTNDQQAVMAIRFFQGDMSDAEADSLLENYGVRYILVPIDSPAMRFVRCAKLRWTGQRLRLYEIAQNEMKALPALTKVPSGRYVWDQR